jgi:hypothetical protein
LRIVKGAPATPSKHKYKHLLKENHSEFNETDCGT